MVKVEVDESSWLREKKTLMWNVLLDDPSRRLRQFKTDEYHFVAEWNCRVLWNYHWAISWHVVSWWLHVLIHHHDASITSTLNKCCCTWLSPTLNFHQFLAAREVGGRDSFLTASLLSLFLSFLEWGNKLAAHLSFIPYTLHPLSLGL